MWLINQISANEIMASAYRNIGVMAASASVWRNHVSLKSSENWHQPSKSTAGRRKSAMSAAYQATGGRRGAAASSGALASAANIAASNDIMAWRQASRHVGRYRGGAAQPASRR
jgi:hypothetical protein